MDSESQDAIAAIESALADLRRRQRPSRGPRGPFGRGEHGGPPWGAGGPPWGDGPPPWGHRGPGHAHDRMSGVARIRLLGALLAAGETRMGISEIATEIGVDQPRASRLVNEAAERGLVSRGVDPTDARRSVVTLTDAGRAAIATARESSRTAVSTALADFTPDEAAQFAVLLARFVGAWPDR